MSSMTLVMRVGLAFLEIVGAGQGQNRDSLLCYSTRSSGVRIVMTLVTSVTSGMQVTLDWLVSLVTLAMLLM